jgi:EmrB/QacA subfamily drug resistance transporter
VSTTVDQTREANEAPQPVPVRPHLPLPPGRRMWVTAGIMVGMFLAALEATVVSTAMPTVVSALGGIERFSWVFSAYLLTSTVTVPLWGRLSDLYGRKRLYQIGIIVFLVGSALSGASQSMWQLIAARAIQGLGAGALVPLALTIVGEIYTLQERARMQGFFSGVWGLASIIGPLAGGYITDALSWRWVFYINIPFGLIAAGIVGGALVEPEPTRKPVIDYAGAATLTASITLLLFALVEGGQIWGWASGATLASFLGAAALMAAFVAVERRAKDPMVPLDLFADRTFLTTTIVGFFVGTAMFGAISFIPLFAQGVAGATATQAGSALTPLLLAWVAMSVVGGRIMHRVGLRRMVVSGVAVLTVGFLLLTRFGRGSSLKLLMADMALMGLGMGLTMLTIIISVQAAMPKERLGIATSLSMFARSIGGAIGVATMGAVLATELSAHLGEIAPGGAADPNQLMNAAARASMAPEALAALEGVLAAALRDVFWMGAIAAALGLLSSFWIPARLSGRHGGPH